MATDRRQRELTDLLRSLGINATFVPYPAHSTVEEGRALRGSMPGTFTKNLLLKDKKDRLFLVVAEETRSVNLRTLHTKIGANGRLGFASPELVRDLLQVEPGTITPLALMYDSMKMTTVVLDRTIMTDMQLNFHPLVQTESVGLTPVELQRFFTATGHRYLTAELET